MLAALVAAVMAITLVPPDGWLVGATEPAAHGQTLDDLDEAEERVGDLSQ